MVQRPGIIEAEARATDAGSLKLENKTEFSAASRPQSRLAT